MKVMAIKIVNELDIDTEGICIEKIFGNLNKQLPDIKSKSEMKAIIGYDDFSLDRWPDEAEIEL